MKIIQDRFYSKAKQLRAHFDQRFSDPKAQLEGRFVWDYWHVPNQYTLLRTPAYQFFPKAMYEAFHRNLVLWGRENLGCHDISPPWLSCYVDGCEQLLHGDLPHGPWAFVFSLSPPKPMFRGGETLMLKDEILSYWSQFQTGRGLEEEQIFEKVSPHFNRLVVFDPRVPHGVSRVEGPRDVRDGRLVIHGWFVQPRPFIRGALRPAALQSAIDGLSEVISQVLSDSAGVNGVLSLRFAVARSGQVRGIKTLTNTLRSASGDDVQRAARSPDLFGCAEVLASDC